MSVNSWKEEFYSEKAKDVANSPILDKLDKSETDLLLIEHSLMKWKGLSKDNLKKHGLWSSSDSIMESTESFKIGAKSCALCIVYLKENSKDYSLDDDGEISYCTDCPLYQSRNNKSCDMQLLDAHGEEIETASPYHKFYRSGNEKPMVEALEKAKRFVIRLKEIKDNASST